MTCFTLLACDVLCIMCSVLLIDGDRLHGSSPPVYHLVVDVLLSRLGVLGVVDSHW
jgi:hypothetical protein